MRYNRTNAGDNNYVTLLDSHRAIVGSLTDKIPYSAVIITTGDMNYNGIRFTGGIYSKGVVDIDYLSTNVRLGGLTNSTPFANGNYLLVSNNTGSSTYGVQFYVGWDPSNPDIKQDASWTAYTE